MSEPLEIRSETRLSFEIDHGRDQWLLRATMGDWVLQNAGNGSYENIGSVKRLNWRSALNRALEKIGAYVDERDGL